MAKLLKGSTLNQEISICKAILRNLFSKRYKNLAWIFYEPIDAQILGLFDYHDIIKEPMDLSTVRQRLNTNFYVNAVDFARDVRLIFYNAYLYTNPGHLCYEMAKKLQFIFEDLYAKVPLNRNCTESTESLDWSDSSSEIDVEQLPSGSNESICQSQQNRVLLAPDGMQMLRDQMNAFEDWRNDDLDFPMTTEEDLELHIRVQQLDGVMLLNVIHMIHQMEGMNFKYPKKELEFDMRNLRTQTKRSIMAFLASKGITGKRISRIKKNY